MAYRFTNTEKWQDSWFTELTQLQMLLFLYLCDNCDIAGFIEVNYKRWASDLGSSKETIEGACKGLARGLIYSKLNDCIFIRNFLKHQKNLPLNENNKAHLGIIKRFELYLYKFEYQTINELIEGACKGLPSPSGIGNGIGNEPKSELKFIDEFYLPIINKWLKYKSDRKEKYKSIESIELFYNKLIKMSNNNIDLAKLIIEQSMANNWAGIFELKQNNLQKQSEKQVFVLKPFPYAE